jgi:hypothetical protein
VQITTGTSSGFTPRAEQEPRRTGHGTRARLQDHLPTMDSLRHWQYGRHCIRTSGLPVKAKIQCTQPRTTDFSDRLYTVVYTEFWLVHEDPTRRF